MTSRAVSSGQRGIPWYCANSLGIPVVVEVAMHTALADPPVPVVPAVADRPHGQGTSAGFPAVDDPNA
jgi:hypothetical protein